MIAFNAFVTVWLGTKSRALTRIRQSACRTKSFSFSPYLFLLLATKRIVMFIDFIDGFVVIVECPKTYLCRCWTIAVSLCLQLSKNTMNCLFFFFFLVALEELFTSKLYHLFGGNTYINLYLQLLWGSTYIVSVGKKNVWSLIWLSLNFSYLITLLPIFCFVFA